MDPPDTEKHGINFSIGGQHASNTAVMLSFEADIALHIIASILVNTAYLFCVYKSWRNPAWGLKFLPIPWAGLSATWISDGGRVPLAYIKPKTVYGAFAIGWHVMALEDIARRQDTEAPPADAQSPASKSKAPVANATPTDAFWWASNPVFRLGSGEEGSKASEEGKRPDRTTLGQPLLTAEAVVKSAVETLALPECYRDRVTAQDILDLGQHLAEAGRRGSATSMAAGALKVTSVLGVLGFVGMLLLLAPLFAAALNVPAVQRAVEVVLSYCEALLVWMWQSFLHRIWKHLIYANIVGFSLYLSLVPAKVHPASRSLVTLPGVVLLSLSVYLAWLRTADKCSWSGCASPSYWYSTQDQDRYSCTACGYNDLVYYINAALQIAITGLLAIKYQSRLLGFVASYLVFYLLGFAVIPLGMGYAVGWASEGALVTSHVASGILLVCFIAVDWARLFPEQSIQPFRIGITVMGSVVHFLSALIMSSSFYFVDSMTSFFLMNAWALFGMMAGAAAGFMLQEDAVGNTAAVFLALWVLDKPVELLARAGGFFPVLGAFAFFLGLYVISINVRARSDIVQRLLERLLPKPLVGPKVQ